MSDRSISLISAEEIVALYREQGFQNVNCKTSNPAEPGLLVITIEKNIQGKKCLFRIKFGQAFPSELPTFFLDNYTDFPIMAHVGRNGEMCLFEKDFTLLDPFNPLGIADAAAQRAIEITRKGLLGHSKSEVFEEFDAFVSAVPSCINASSILPEGDTPAIIEIYRGKQVWVGQSRQHLRAYFERTGIEIGINKSNFQKAIYVPLPIWLWEKLPSFTWQRWWSLPELRNIFWQGLKGEEMRWASSLLRPENCHLPIVFKLPLSSGANVHFGVGFFQGVGVKHPMCKVQAASQAYPIKINRMDQNYLLPRGGASVALSEKKVLLIGCGSVGGYIATGLAKSGVGSLTLIDPDNFKSENLYRHVLGQHAGLGKPKVELLKNEIESSLPFCNVQAINASIEEEFSTKKLAFGEFDIVVVATGKDNLNFVVNSYFLDHYPGTPVVFTWLDPLGIGGHSLLTNVEPKGCYMCLFDEDPEHGLYNKASFTGIGQSFSQSMAGCHGRFVEFSNLDAEQTALHTVRLSIKVLSGRINHNQILSWKGDAEIFELKGFQLADRFQQTTEELYANRFGFSNERCVTCGNYHRRGIPQIKTAGTA